MFEHISFQVIELVLSEDYIALLCSVRNLELT